MKKTLFLIIGLILSIQFNANSQDMITGVEAYDEQPYTLVDAEGDPNTYYNTDQNVKAIADEVLKVITQDTSVSIVIPSPLDPTNPNNIFEWWMFLYGLLMPIGLWLFHKLRPSSTKKELVIKSTTAAIIVIALIIIGLGKGLTLPVLFQSVFAFVMQWINYEKVLKPLGLKSPREKTYDKTIT